ncbi:hypothetical protein C8F04DRAFT_1281200 [Mycena alexandri]|uniref:Uncharacterized protein n=1 Tax=Mycena alexandri TaxID=1745969 RepID=A0AAD6WPU2_9AGAR|nr:hypothetical protein C8F04DRAFT_1281200 [Mycena alexandri]
MGAANIRENQITRPWTALPHASQWMPVSPSRAHMTSRRLSLHGCLDGSKGRIGDEWNIPSMSSSTAHCVTHPRRRFEFDPPPRPAVAVEHGPWRLIPRVAACSTPHARRAFSGGVSVLTLPAYLVHTASALVEPHPLPSFRRLPPLIID